MLEVISLRLIHYKNDSIVHGLERLLIIETRWIHLKLSLTYMRLIW